MKKLFLFASALFLSATTMFATAPESLPTAPTAPANQVKAVYSAAYTADCGFGDWGSGTVYAQEDYGKKFTTTNLGYFGLIDFALNCTKMEKIHLDVWFEAAGSFRVVPIHGGPEQGVTVTVGAEEVNTWKSVDLALNEGAFASVTDWSNVYQVKIDNVPNQTFWLNNIYFYTSQAPEEEATELFVPANASFNAEKSFGQFVKPEGTWDAITGTFTIVIKQQSEWQWGNQAFLNTGITTLSTAKEYQVSFDIVASTADCGGVTFKAFDDNQIAWANQNIAVTNVVQTWTSEWTKPGAEATNGMMVWDFGWDPAQTVTISNISIKERVSQAPPTPEITAPQVPTVDAAKVKAIACETYKNNLGWLPQGWGGCNWVDTCVAGVNFFYAKTMAWDCFASDWVGAGVADYTNLHFDIWFAEAGNNPVIKLEFNNDQPATAEITIPGEYKAGWNSVNVNVKDVFGEQPMNDLKCLTVKVAKEGGPVAWANILFFNGSYTSTEATGTCGSTPVWPEDAPTEAPAAPTVDGASILGVEHTTTYQFAPLDWPGTMPQLLTFATGENIYFMSRMTWQIYTNWEADYFDFSEYNMLHVDIFPATGTEIKVTIEALGDGEGGSGYKNSVVKALTAGQWNGLDIALSEFPAMNDGGEYDFSDVKYFILEGYNAEQTPMSVGNVYFYSAATGLNDVMNVKAIRKVMHNNHVMIMRNGVRYNLVGTIVK